MNEFQSEIDEAMITYNCANQSFNRGLALYYMMHNCVLSEELRDYLYNYIDEAYGEVVAMLKRYGLSDGDLAVWSELIPLDVLDELARDLGGNDEDK